MSDVDVRVAGPVTRRRLMAAAAGVGAALSTTSLAACARQQTVAPVELSLYTWGPELPPQWTLGPGLNPRVGVGRGPSGTPVPVEKVIEQQLAPLTADRVDLTVKVMTERQERYHEKLRAFALAGQMPDVVAYDGTQAMPLIRSNLLYHLGRLQGASNRTFLQAFPTSYMDASSYRGKLFGVPYQSRQLVLFVNKTAFGSQVALPPQEWGIPSWTWAAFLERASALTQRSFGGGYSQFGTLLTGRPMWASLIRQNGGLEFNRELTRSNYDVPEVYEAIQWATELVNRYRVAPTELQNPKGASWNFDNGNVAMWVWFQHAAPQLLQRIFNFEWDIYPLPMNRKTATYAEWSYLSVSANTKDVDRSWEIVRFLCSAEGDAQALRNGVAGPIQRGTEPGFMTGLGGRNKAAAIQAAQQTMVSRPQHEAWDQVYSLIDFYLRPVWSGTTKAIYACRDLRLAVDAVLAGLETPKAPAVGNAPAEEPTGGG